MDLTSALQDTVRLLKRKEAIQQALAMDLVDEDEAAEMRAKLAFEYAVLRTIYLLPTQSWEIPESSQAEV